VDSFGDTCLHLIGNSGDYRYVSVFAELLQHPECVSLINTRCVQGGALPAASIQMKLLLNQKAVSWDVLKKKKTPKNVALLDLANTQT